MVDPGLFKKLTRKVFSGLSKGEVKTPLSFFFRVVAYEDEPVPSFHVDELGLAPFLART